MTVATERIEISNTDDVIDVRDIIARVEQLEPIRQPGAVDLGNDDDNNAAQDDLFAELASLESLLDELRGNGGNEKWRGAWYPLTLVRESHFEDFARQEAEDLDLIKRDAHWPNNHINWEAAAEELKGDYSTVEFDGETYYYNA